jgi:accessory gene regulator B
MISAISKKLANSLGTTLMTSAEQIEIYAYGLEIILGAVIKLVLILFLAFLLGTLDTTIILFVFFALFRCFGGGAHLSTYPRCLVFGVCLIVSLGYLAQTTISINTLIILSALSLALNIFTCIKWVPAGTEKKYIIEPSLRLRQKQRYFLVIIGWCLTLLLLIKLSLLTYGFAVLLGSFGAMLLILPSGYWLLNTIDNLC